MSRGSDVIVIGGGVIGCSIAYQLASRGCRVRLLERGRLGAEATAAAAGMLGAQAEMADTGPLFQLSRRSRALFPALAEELRSATGIDIGLVAEGLLHAALTEEQERELRGRTALQQAAGETACWLPGDEVRRLEPAAGQSIRGAVWMPEDGHVQAPQLAQAFARAAVARGAELREYAQVTGLLGERGRIVGAATAEGPLYADHVVVAAGAWSSQLLTDAGVDLPVYPVQGECFSVIAEQPLLRKTLYTEGCYIVPKAGGRLIVGATMNPRSYDRKVSLAGIALLLERAAKLLPAIGGAEWERAWSGLRPQTAQGLPYIGRVDGADGLYAAVGHYRNGILLSPITGLMIADLVTNGGGDAFGAAAPAAEAERGAEKPGRKELHAI